MGVGGSEPLTHGQTLPLHSGALLVEAAGSALCAALTPHFLLGGQCPALSRPNAGSALAGSSQRGLTSLCPLRHALSPTECTWLCFYGGPPTCQGSVTAVTRLARLQSLRSSGSDGAAGSQTARQQRTERQTCLQRTPACAPPSPQLLEGLTGSTARLPPPPQRAHSAPLPTLGSYSAPPGFSLSCSLPGGHPATSPQTRGCPAQTASSQPLPPHGQRLGCDSKCFLSESE